MKKGDKGGFEFDSSRDHYLLFFNELQVYYASCFRQDLAFFLEKLGGRDRSTENPLLDGIADEQV